MKKQENIVICHIPDEKSAESSEKSAEEIILDSFQTFLKKELQNIAKQPCSVV